MTTMIEAVYCNGAPIPKHRLKHIREGQTVYGETERQKSLNVKSIRRLYGRK